MASTTASNDDATVEKPALVEDDGFALHGLPFIAVMASFCLGCFIAGLDWT